MSRRGTRQTLSRFWTICARQEMSKTIGCLQKKNGSLRARCRISFLALRRLEEDNKDQQKLTLTLEICCWKTKNSKGKGLSRRSLTNWDRSTPYHMIHSTCARALGKTAKSVQRGNAKLTDLVSFWNTIQIPTQKKGSQWTTDVLHREVYMLFVISLVLWELNVTWLIPENPGWLTVK